MSKCKFCGTSSLGTCSYSPHGKHEHSNIGSKFTYCGSSSYVNCSFSPSGKHEH